MTVVVILAVVFVLHSAGGKKPSATGPRPLTGDQADRLAVSRFLDYQAKGVRFSTTVPTAQGSLPLAGDIDFRRHLGYAATRLDAGGREQTAVLQWNGTTVQTWLDAGDGLAPPARLPSAKPTGRRIVAASSGLDTLLVLLLDLGADRPDNAQLLQQSDARWLRTDTVDGQRVDVIRGPSPAAASAGAGGSSAAGSSATAPTGGTEYWIDATGRLLRFSATIGSTAVTIDLVRTGFTAFPRSPAL